jgi:membrane-bound lytic murein transglycosylase A
LGPGVLRNFRSTALVLASALTLAACVTRPPTPMGPIPVGPPPSSPPPAPQPAARPETFADLPGWANEDHAAAFEAFRTTCGVARDPALAEVCRRARASGPLDPLRARAFLEANFRPELVVGDGVLTAYFSPEYEARDRPDAEFSAPVRPKPVDLVASGPGSKDAARRGPNGVLDPYPDRS